MTALALVSLFAIFIMFCALIFLMVCALLRGQTRANRRDRIEVRLNPMFGRKP